MVSASRRRAGEAASARSRTASRFSISAPSVASWSFSWRRIPWSSQASPRPAKKAACRAYAALASPLASSCSRAYSWMVSYMSKRSSWGGRGPTRTRRRDLSRSASTTSMGAGAAGWRERSRTCSAARSENPPRNTAHWAIASRSQGVSRPQDQSMVARSVAWRADGDRDPAPRSRRFSRRSSTAWALSTPMRAAASSMASGSPSRRRTMAAMNGASVGDGVYP
ncbi:Hypothetical protein A7982_07985 [Minicystis rosea]|nr:Hypothetical protein A7982_07985 [Minicystis rosea]